MDTQIHRTTTVNPSHACAPRVKKARHFLKDRYAASLSYSTTSDDCLRVLETVYTMLEIPFAQGIVTSKKCN